MPDTDQEEEQKIAEAESYAEEQSLAAETSTLNNSATILKTPIAEKIGH